MFFFKQKDRYSFLYIQDVKEETDLIAFQSGMLTLPFIKSCTKSSTLPLPIRKFQIRTLVMKRLVYQINHLSIQYSALNVQCTLCSTQYYMVYQ